VGKIAAGRYSRRVVATMPQPCRRFMGKETNMAASAAAAAAAAAAAKARQEEEEMTPYTPQDLAEGWEFKILRAVTNKFRDPLVLHGILQEEARAGWILVEKFDDMRVRLKRPARARANDAALDFDPYRTWVGISQARYTGIVLGVTFGIVAVIALVTALAIYIASHSGH
jgi:hypothetical protein